MTHCQKINFLLFDVESVDDSIITNPHTVPVDSGHPVVWIILKSSAHFINFSFDAALNLHRKAMKTSVEAG